MKRWLDDPSGLSGDEQRALDAGIRVRRGSPGDGDRRSVAKRAVWSALALELPVVPIDGSSAASGPGAIAGSAGVGSAGGVLPGSVGFFGALAKPLVMGLLVGTAASGAVAASYHLTSSNSPTSSAVRSKSTISAAPPGLPKNGGVSTPAPALEHRGVATPFPSDRDTRPPQGAARHAAPPRVGAAEVHRMAAARTLLRSNQPSQALIALDSIGRDFPNGLLAQERETMAIEALLALGDRVRARERAARFLERYPQSPHAATARRARDPAP